MLNERIYLSDSTTAYLETYLLNKNLNEITEVKRPALIICPGGCYLYKSYREGEPVAMQFSTFGYQCFILSYSTLWKKKYYHKKDIQTNALCPYPQPVYELYESVKLIRENADEWGIDPDKIYVLGFSAGGHLAASGALNWSNPEFYQKVNVCNPEMIKPNATVLCYPMLDAELIRERAVNIDQFVFEREEDEIQADYLLDGIFGTKEPTKQMWDMMDLTKQINKDTPPFFIWHTFEDQVTLAEQTTKFVSGLLKNKIRCEYHLFSRGHHGMSLATPAVATIPGDYLYNNAIWPVLADLFLKNLN